jgi:hypothetical protein
VVSFNNIDELKSFDEWEQFSKLILFWWIKYPF